MATVKSMPIIQEFRKNIKKRSYDIPLVSATHVGTIVGLNKYECNRDLILRQLNVRNQPKIELSQNDPRSIGIRYEKKAVELFCKRNGIPLNQGFKPPYVFTETEGSKSSRILLGGEGDFIFKNSEKKNVLLEIKCLVYRKITNVIPLQYWLQVQTMLYVYYLLNLDIDHAIYCENTVDEHGVFGSFWETRIDLDKNYYEDKILPILVNYYQILERGMSRSRSEVSVKPIPPPLKRSSLQLSNDFFKRGNNKLITRVHHKNMYSHFLSSNNIFGPQCLHNYLKNNHLRDWYYHNESSESKFNNTLVRGEYHNDYINISEILTNITPILKYSDNNHTIVNIEDLIRPLDSRVCQKPINENFSPIKYSETIKALQSGSDIISGGQLYNPEKAVWVNFDLLIRNDLLKDTINPPNGDKEQNVPIEPRQFPKHYTPLKVIRYRYNTDNFTTRKARLELLIQLEALNFYYSNENTKFLILDSDKKITEIDVEKIPKLTKQYESGMEWLTVLTDESSILKVDPPNDNRLFPNCKVSTKDIPFEEFKNTLIEKNDELTTLWSISNLMRDKLVNSRLHIKSVKELEHNINSKTVRNILGPIYNNIKNILLANRTNNIIKLSTVRNELRDLKEKTEIFLDFEFSPDFIYVIGLYQVTPLVSKRTEFLSKCLDRLRMKHGFSESEPKAVFKQFVLKDNTDDSHADLLNEFAKHINTIASRSSSIINCYHWGQVEERLVKKWLPDIFDKLNFIDIHEMIVDNALAIPGCKSYTIKDVAKSLRELGHINTEWEENTDGYWCNQTLNGLLNKDSKSPKSPEDPEVHLDPPVNLRSCDGFNKILDYNHTDCKVLFDIVKFFRN